MKVIKRNQFFQQLSLGLLQNDYSTVFKLFQGTNM